MNSVTIKQSEQQMEYNVPSTVINKLAELDSNNVDLDLQGSVTLSGGVYESKVNQLTDKYQDFHITAPSTYIEFESPEVERVLVANGFSSDGVGITTTDAAIRKTSIASDLFNSNKSITNFNELSRFTSLKTIGRGAFFNSSIYEIDLSNIEDIGSNAFRSCNLAEVNLQNVKSINIQTFHSAQIQKVIIGNKINALGKFDPSNSNEYNNSQLFNSAQIGELTISETVTKIDQSVFSKATITTLNVDESVFTEGGKFYNYVKDVWNYANLLSLNQDGWFVTSNDQSETTYQNQIYFPKVTTTKGGHTAYAGALRYGTFIGNRRDYLSCNLMYFRDVTSFGPATFYKTSIANLIINNTTPPSITQTYPGLDYESNVLNILTDYYADVFVGITAIGHLYVPDTAVAAYQADTKYNSIGVDKILPISQCPKYATKELWEAAGKPVALIEEYM